MSKCLFCFVEMRTCKKCGKEHCTSRRGRGCCPIVRCDNPPTRRSHDPLTAAPHGFRILERTGMAGGRSHE